MHTEIRKAVIPAAGLGTRMLPIARTVPKEMLPIVDRPAISYLVEEAAAAGATDILIITNRGKDSMEEYFDYSLEYEDELRRKGLDREADSLRKAADCANVYFLRQKQTRGLGHAILRARDFIGREPFYVLYGDDVIFAEKPVCLQLKDAYDAYGLACAAVQEVSEELVMKYCTLAAEPLSGRAYHVSDMIEKPAREQILSHFSILGREILTPEIFEILQQIPLGHGGELQLTDAMRILARTRGMTAVDFEGKRYDMGSKLGFLQANVERALLHPELGEEFRAYLKHLAATL